MLDSENKIKSSVYPEEWLVSKKEAKEMEKIDEAMRLKVKDVLKKLKE